MAVEQAEVDPAKVDELMGRLIRDFAGAGSIPLTMIGISTGLWRAMAGAGPLTPAEVAERSGTAERWDGADDATSAFIGADLPAWLAALDGLENRLRAGARVADVGCGYARPRS